MKYYLVLVLLAIFLVASSYAQTDSDSSFDFVEVDTDDSELSADDMKLNMEDMPVTEDITNRDSFDEMGMNSFDSCEVNNNSRDCFNIENICRTLANDLNLAPKNATALFVDGMRVSYKNPELPFGGQYRIYKNHTNPFLRKLRKTANITNYSYSYHAVDRMNDLCNIKVVASGTFYESGKEFTDIDWYTTFKVIHGHIVGARVYDGKNYGKLMTAYRTPARQAVYNLARAIHKYGYASKIVKSMFATDARIILSNIHETKKFKSIKQTVNYILDRMIEGPKWRSLDPEDEDDPEARKKARAALLRRLPTLPFVMPYLSTEYECVAQQGPNNTVLAGTCTFPLRKRGHGHHHHCHRRSHRHHHAHAEEDHGMNMDMDFAHHHDHDHEHHHHHHCSHIGEFYLRGQQIYFHIHINDAGLIDMMYMRYLDALAPDNKWNARFNTQSGPTSRNTM